MTPTPLGIRHSQSFAMVLVQLDEFVPLNCDANGVGRCVQAEVNFVDFSRVAAVEFVVDVGNRVAGDGADSVTSFAGYRHGVVGRETERGNGDDGEDGQHGKPPATPEVTDNHGLHSCEPGGSSPPVLV
ncbi:MAG: hypothetical protein M5U18_16520 [Dehalococcoidia bacterium]|nr:hypothetical protein [Dehalococcoidia bacterium]